MNQDRYETARVAGKLVVFVGWLAFAGGIVATLTAGAAGGTVAALATLPAAIGGLLAVAAGQLMSAVLDIADDTRQTAEATRLMLERLDDALDIAKWLAKPAIEARRSTIGGER